MTETSHTRCPKRGREGLQSSRDFSLARGFSMPLHLHPLCPLQTTRHPALKHRWGQGHHISSPPPRRLLRPQLENPTGRLKPIRKPRWGISCSVQGSTGCPRPCCGHGCAKMHITIFRTRSKQGSLVGLHGVITETKPRSQGSLVLAVVLSLLFLLQMQKPFFFLFFPTFARNL